MNRNIRLFDAVLWLSLLFLLVACGDDDSSSDSWQATDDDASDDDDESDDDDSDDDDSASEGDFTATLESNPICDISCVVTWTTDQAASSWVEFGEENEGYTARIGSDDPVCAHEVIVVGMHAETRYRLRAVSETGSKGRMESQEMSFAAGSLPSIWMTAELDVHDESQAQDGWTLTNLAGASMATSLVVVLYDMSGQVVWYYCHPTGTGRMDNAISLIDGNRILIGPGVPLGEKIFAMDLKGEVVWEGLEQVGLGMNDNGALHHVLAKLEDGHFVTTQNDIRNGIIGDEILVFDENLDPVWSWNFWDHLTPATVGPGGAWTHVNSVSFDPDADCAFISAYNLHQILKVDMATDEIVWVLGQDGDFEEDPTAEEPWFTGSHGIETLGENQILLYDNGDVSRPYSRAVIYDLDEAEMKATLAWEYDGEDDSDHFYNMSVGDADRLENGNILITAGNGAQNQSPTRFIEVTPDGEKVWQLWLYTQADKRIASFEADRIPSLAESLN